MAGRGAMRLGGGLDLLGVGQRRRERPLRSQSGAGFEKGKIEGGASYAAQFAIGETLVRGLEIYRAAETVEETGSPYSESAPGVGRRLHLAFALSEGKCEALQGIVVDGEVLTGAAFAKETDVSADDDGGVTYTATTGRGGELRVTSYLDAPDRNAERRPGFVSRGKTLRDASARMGSEALEWNADHQGSGISWCHVELLQPVGLDRLVWDGVPELGFLMKGMHLKAPAAGDPSTWSPSYTDSAAAVRYWWLSKRRSAPAERIDVATVRDAHDRTGQRIEVRLDATVRYAWLATADADDDVESSGTVTAPAAPAGNEFLPERPTGLAGAAPWWSKTPVAPMEESPLVWRAESVLDAGGAWSDWAGVILYQEVGFPPHVDVRPAGDPEPVLPSAPVDGSAYVVEFDRYTEGLPAGLNPGNPEDPVRLALEADATSSRFGVSGVISAADAVDRVEEELDFAWAGSVVEQDGMLCFRPGADGVSSATIDTSAAGQAAVSVELPPPLEERINAASLSLSCSRIHGGAGYSLPAIEDAVSLAADGGSASRDLGEAALLSSPTAARRLLSTALRASQASGSYRYRVEAGAAGAWLSLRPGRQVTVTDSARGFSGASMVVTGATLVRDTATVELDLVEQSSGTFNDVVALPVRALESAARALAQAEKPDALELLELLGPNGDGTFELHLRASWKAHPYESMELQWRRLTPDSRADWRDAATVLSYGFWVDLAPVLRGASYEARARHVSRGGQVSRWSYAEPRPIKGDRTAMARPRVLEGASMPGGVRLEWAQPEEPDYAHTQVTTRDPGAQETRTWTVKGTYFERYFETLPAPPVSQRYLVRHVDRSGNASAAATVMVAPLAVVDRVGVIRDSVYLAQAAGGTAPPAPNDIDGSSGWTRKPVAPTPTMPVVWQAYREAELDGKANPTWSEWSVPELYAVENDSTVDGFTTHVELQFQSLALDGSVVAESATCIEPTYEAPLVEARQRFRASSAASSAWDDLVHCWTAVARLTPDGAVYGVKARLDTGFGCDPDQERTIYRRSASHLTPANPTGNAAVPSGWHGHERIATSSFPYVYKLTVRATDCVWPDWSDAGTPELHDEWTAQYFWWITTPEEPVPATPEGFDPFPWMPSRPLLTMPPQCRWVALRAGSPLGGYFWGAPEDDGCRLETSIYMRTVSAVVPANPSSTLELPPGWSTEKLCATATEGFVYCLTVIPANGEWPWADAGPAVLFDRWTSTPHWRITATDAAPPAPTGDEPADWTAQRPETTTSLPYRWVSTREGSDCAGHTWTAPMQDDRTIYKRTNSATPPPRPSGIAEAPSGWSTAKEAATSSQRYVYCLTVSFENGAWNDWSTGALVLFDQWTVTQYWRLTATNSVPATPAVPEPEGWVAMADAPTDQMPFRWKSTRSGSPCAGYTWTARVPAPVPDLGIVATNYNYAFKLAASRPPTPGGTSYPPPGWSTTDLEPTREENVWWTGQTVTNGVAGAWSRPALWKTVRCAYKEAASRPATPSGTSYPPSGWLTSPPAPGPLAVWETCQAVAGDLVSLWSRPGVFRPAEPDLIRYAYKQAVLQPATPGGTSYSPKGWSLVELEPSWPSYIVWRTSQTVTNDVASGWSFPVSWKSQQCVHKLASSRPMPPTDSPLPDWSEDVPNQTETMRVWRSCRTVIDGAEDPWSTPETVFPDPRTVYKLASSKPATPSDGDRWRYPPGGWSLVELEPTTSFNLWQSTQVFLYGSYAPWGEPRFVRGHTGPRHAYKRAASRPATPTSRAWPPPGWRAERLDATSSADVWQTTQMLTNGVPGEWSTPVRIEVREETDST